MKAHCRDNFCSPYKLAFHRMQRCLEANGVELVTDPAQADVLVGGVCAAFEADEDRSVALAEELAALGKPLHLIGCMVRVRPQRLPPARTYFSWQHDELVRELVPGASVDMSGVTMPSVFRLKSDYRIFNPKKQFVTLSLGCAFDCSYCPHKLGAGDLQSRPPAEILAQVEELAAEGVSDIILTGIDTASYGKDLGGSLPGLLESILARAPQGLRFHVAQFNPEGIMPPDDRAAMIRCCADERVVDLQMPVQSSSPRVLGLMKRGYDPEVVAEFAARIRQGNPGLFLRTDLMVGFPTETQEEFAASVEYVAGLFHEAAVYAYEPKRGTDIYDAGVPFLEPAVVLARKELAVRRLRDAGLIVHSGGQDMESLLRSDRRKHKQREEA